MKRSEAKYIRRLILEAGERFSDDEIASRLVLLDEWTSGTAYAADQRIRYNGAAYKCIQAHTSQSDWMPSAVPALWAAIDVVHAGTLSDPIAYTTGMEIENGKYYIQFDVIYLCTRDSGQPLYHNLSDLVGLYVTQIAD